jgi:dienelactone hydrolase
MSTQEYAPGRLVDVVGDPSHPTVLLWHGTQSNARGTVRHLAAAIAGHRLAVVVPDWDSHASDGGCVDLLQSVQFARHRPGSDSEALVIVGWSLGGVAAAGLTLTAQTFGVRVAHTVCLAGAFTARDPVTGRPISVPRATSEAPTPFTLLHGSADTVVPVENSTRFAVDLEQAGWPVATEVLDADHGSIAGAKYDPDADRYDAVDDEPTRRIVDAVAARIAAVAHDANP